MPGKRNNISCIKNDEPSFIKAFKQRVGYKEGPTLDTKREELHYEEEDRPEAEDEKPVVVVLRTGDLTANEAEKAKKDLGVDDDEDIPEDGKIKFKKPKKRESDKQSVSEDDSSAAKKSKDDGQKKKKSKDKKPNLLSFNDEEEDEDT